MSDKIKQDYLNWYRNEFEIEPLGFDSHAFLAYKAATERAARICDEASKWGKHNDEVRLSVIAKEIRGE